MSSTADKPDDLVADLLELSADLAAKYVSKNYLPSDQVTPFFRAIYKQLSDDSERRQSPHGDSGADRTESAVSVADSVQNDYLICLEDGQKRTMLKRYLRTKYNISPTEYRKKWNLPPDYPMVAPSQALKRSRNAKKSALRHVAERSSQT